MRFPIAAKLILLVVLFLIIATSIFATSSSRLFETVLVQREEYSNMTQVSVQADQIEQIINGAIERAQITGTLMVKRRNQGGSRGGTKGSLGESSGGGSFQSSVDDEVAINFDKDKNLVSMDVFHVLGNRGVELVQRRIKEEFFKQNAMEGELYIQKLRNVQKFPLASVIQKNIEIRNSTITSKGPALITIGFPLMRDERNNVTHLVLADFQLSLLQKPFSGENERIQYLLDRRGYLLAHQDEQKVLSNLSLRDSPLVEKALSDEHPRRQIQFIDSETQKVFIGAYVKKTNLGLTVVCQTPRDVILEPALQVRRKAYFIAGQLISVAIFVIFIFSTFLTRPIEKLAYLIQFVSKGNFNLRARSQVRSRDEVGDLATAFDQMTEGLKERDKMKDLFGKFHGSSITEDLLKKDISVGGQSKDVTVFFSDIRGFTSFSEKHTAEQVVEMLNEYFSIMVNIITQYNGVVDKFIGDAIMAVWGVPRGSPLDTYNAVRASLAMRSALEELNQKREKLGQEPILIGIGLHAGKVISGNIGSLERMEYTVIGDTVNMTSRIESSTKAFGADLLVSEAVSEKVPQDFRFELAGSAQVKGKSEPLKLFKVRAYKEKRGEEEQWVEVRTAYSDYESGEADKVKIAS